MGKFVKSAIGDYSDVKIVTPFGDIPWMEASRFNNGEMKTFNKDVFNKIYTFLLYYLKEETAPSGSSGLRNPPNWDGPEIDQRIKSFWDWARKSEDEQTKILSSKTLNFTNG